MGRFVAALVLLLLAVAAAVLIADDDGEPGGAAATAPRPELRPDGVEFPPREPEAYAPRAEFAVTNAGSAASSLQHVSFTVRDVAHIHDCYGDEDEDLSREAAGAIPLPVGSKAGDVVLSPALPRSIHPGQTERLSFDFELKGPAPGEVVVFGMDVALYHDDEPKPVDLSSIVILTPINVISLDGFLFARPLDAELLGPELLELEPDKALAQCLLDNTLDLHELLARAGERPSEFVHLQRQIYSPEEARELAAKYGAT
jgi:hypothetical protein